MNRFQMDCRRRQIHKKISTIYLFRSKIITTNFSGAGDSIMDPSFAEKCGLENRIDRRKRTTLVGIAGAVKTIGRIYLCERLLFF